MKKVVIFGAGGTGQALAEQFQTKGQYHVVAFADNDISKLNTSPLGIPVISPKKIVTCEYDKVIVGSNVSPDELVLQLIELGIDEEAIDVSYVCDTYQNRIDWLKDYAAIAAALPGNVAEAGVFRGDFAKIINSCFPEKKLYLFDTFEGFDERDIYVQKEVFEAVKVGHMSGTSPDLVMSKVPYPDKCVIKKGFFPETAQDVEDQFCFVNIDMDLQQPVYEGIRFFYPKMVAGGVILVHDYYSIDYGQGIKRAIAEYQRENECKLSLLPIGDKMSVAIVV